MKHRARRAAEAHGLGGRPSPRARVKVRRRVFSLVSLQLEKIINLGHHRLQSLKSRGAGRGLRTRTTRFASSSPASSSSSPASPSPAAATLLRAPSLSAGASANAASARVAADSSRRGSVLDLSAAALEAATSARDRLL